MPAPAPEPAPQQQPNLCKGQTVSATKMECAYDNTCNNNTTTIVFYPDPSCNCYGQNPTMLNWKGGDNDLTYSCDTITMPAPAPEPEPAPYYYY